MIFPVASRLRGLLHRAFTSRLLRRRLLRGSGEDRRGGNLLLDVLPGGQAGGAPCAQAQQDSQRCPHRNKAPSLFGPPLLDGQAYLAKPFAVPELLARVRAMLRRKGTFSPGLLQAGPLTLNRSTYELCWNGRTQPLSGREFQVMEMLMERPGCVVPCDDLLFHVWGWDSPVEVNVVWVHISNLRKKMEKLGTSASIRFLRGAGYVLEMGA